MSKNLNLEAIRGFASVYVAIGHWILSFANLPFTLKFVFSFGQEAVIIFFILSGYVIKLSWDSTKDNCLRSYFIKRFRRIYFPFIVSILLAIIINPGSFSFKDLVGNLLMLQDFETGKPGNIVNTFMGNTPLWSLSYEWGFYLIFPFLYIPLQEKRSRVTYVGVISVVSLFSYLFFPNHLFLIPTYLLIWWSGLELATLKQKKQIVEFHRIKQLFYFHIISIFILSAVCILAALRNEAIRPGIYPFLFIRHFIFSACFLLFLTYFKKTKNLIAQILKPFSYVSPISYSLYIFHYILFVQLRTSLPLHLEIPFKIILLLALCYITEIKLQPIINKYIK